MALPLPTGYNTQGINTNPSGSLPLAPKGPTLPTTPTPTKTTPAKPAAPAPVVTSKPATDQITNIQSQIANIQAQIAAQKQLNDAKAKEAADAAASAQQNTSSSTGTASTGGTSPIDKSIAGAAGTTNTNTTTQYNGALNRSSDQIAGSVDNGDGTTTVTYKDGQVQVINGPVTHQVDANGQTIMPPPQTAQDANNQSHASVQAQIDAHHEKFQTQMLQFEQGTYPLTASQQAQVDALKQTYQNIMNQQIQANDAFTKGTTVREMISGRTEVFGQVSAGNIQNAINQGIQKVTEIEGKMNDALSTMMAGFQSDNFKLVAAANDEFNKWASQKEQAFKDTQAELDKQQANAIAAAKDARDRQDKITADINGVAKSAAENFAPPAIQDAISRAATVEDAIKAAGTYLQKGTGDVGRYVSYSQMQQSKGLTPMNYGDWYAQDLQKTAAAEFAKAQASAEGKAAGEAGATATDKVQQKLEQQYRQTLSKEFSSRTGSLGIENQKVAQANHLDALFQQYYDPKTGNYNIPTSQYAELAIGLANLISPTGQTAVSDRQAILAKTGVSDLNGAIQYILGTPQTGNTQDMIKNLLDTVDRQAQVAVSNRQAALDDMKAMAPTDLEPSRIEALNKGTNMLSYSGQDRIDGAKVEQFVQSPQAKAPIDSTLNQKISSLTGGKTFNTAGELSIYMSSLPGADPTKVLNVLKSLGLTQ